MFDTLVETETLAAHLGDPGWVVFDCRAQITDPGAGARRYAEGHIPGAVHLSLDRDLSGPVTPDTGRHPLPDPRQFAAKLAQTGVSESTQIVAYDDAGGSHAARLWWLARWLGHRQVAVLNGGWQQWIHESRAVSTEVPVPEPRHFDTRLQEGLWVTTQEVLEGVRGRKRGLLVDVRGPSRYRGQEEPIDPVGGHVPGAVNLPYTESVAADGRFKNPAELRRHFEAAFGATRPEQVVCMCGSGVTACHGLLAMEFAGLKGGRLYAGSWSEWIRDPSRPVARPS
jgi:thiosulfate/3-mercaptopyruvate sulfurtransferase